MQFSVMLRTPFKRGLLWLLLDSWKLVQPVHTDTVCRSQLLGGVDKRRHELFVLAVRNDIQRIELADVSRGHALRSGALFAILQTAANEEAIALLD